MFRSKDNVTVGDTLVKESSALPRKRWTKWIVERIVQNADGTEHAILAFPPGSRNTRRMALTALTETQGWHRLEGGE